MHRDPLPIGDDRPSSEDELDDLEAEFLWLQFGTDEGRRAGVDYAAEYARLGLPMTVSRGGKIIRIHPDGREEVLKVLPVIPYTLPPGVNVMEPTLPIPAGRLEWVRDKLRREFQRREESERLERLGPGAKREPSDRDPEA